MPIFMTLLLIVGLQTASAQDWPKHVPAGPTDEIPVRRLTTWDKVKLGASYYTNPTKAHDMEFVYTYDLDTTVLKSRLYELEKEGTVFCGMVGADAVRLIPCPIVQRKREEKNDQEQLKAVSDRPNLLGQKPQDVLLKKD